VSAPPSGGRWRANLTLLWGLSVYWFVIYPRTREELRRWSRRAAAIVDPELREHALSKLRTERMVLEGAAAFALLAERRHRTHVIRACVTFEAIYELTDALGEQPVADPVAHNKALNRALLSAVEPLTPHEAHLRSIGKRDPDYLHELIDACRGGLMRLPGRDAILTTIERLAALAAETQTLNHAGLHERHRELAQWAAAHEVRDATWWELAAATSSPLGIYALFAAASSSALGSAEVAAIDAAYFPWIGALVWLLESLVDHLEDAGNDNLNYFAQYASRDEAARRLVVLARRAAEAAACLPNGEVHSLLLAGGIALYVSTHEARHPAVRDAVEALRVAVGGPLGLLMTVSRMRRLAGRPAR
jgi:tetraprenyl-beta-curcumene synthase